MGLLLFSDSRMLNTAPAFIPLGDNTHANDNGTHCHPGKVSIIPEPPCSRLADTQCLGGCATTTVVGLLAVTVWLFSVLSLTAKRPIFPVISLPQAQRPDTVD